MHTHIPKERKRIQQHFGAHANGWNLLPPPEFSLKAERPSHAPVPLPQARKPQQNDKESPPQNERFVFFPGAGYKPENANLFHRTFISSMQEALGEDFHVMNSNRGPLKDVLWGAKNGAIPFQEADENKQFEQYLNELKAQIQEARGGNLNILGSSGGSAPAAQVVQYLLDNRKESGLSEDQKITLMLSSKMLNEGSPLLTQLAQKVDDKTFDMAFQDFKGDNVDGIAGIKQNNFKPYMRMMKAAFIATKESRSMSSLTPWNKSREHIHNLVAQNPGKTVDWMDMIFNENKLGSPEQEARGRAVLGSFNQKNNKNWLNGIVEHQQFSPTNWKEPDNEDSLGR